MRRPFPNAGVDEKPGIFFTWPNCCCSLHDYVREALA
jgi:hypothetical protein